MRQEPKTQLGRVVDVLEESAIALMLGLMTLITFFNVIARYVFNSNILWQLEATVFFVCVAGAVRRVVQRQDHGPSGCRCRDQHSRGDMPKCW